MKTLLLCAPILLLAACSGSRLPRMAEMHAEPAGLYIEVDEPAAPSLMDQAAPADLRAILDKPERVTLYTIAEEYELEDEGMSEAEIEKLTQLDSYRILGKAAVSAAEGRRLIDSFERAVNAGAPGSVECFYPHHAIVAEAGGKSVTVLICFMCDNFKVLPRGANNTIEIDKEGMEKTWRDIVATHKLKDISRASWLPEPEDD